MLFCLIIIVTLYSLSELPAAIQAQDDDILFAFQQYPLHLLNRDQSSGTEVLQNQP